MTEQLPSSARRVQLALVEAGIAAQVLELPRSTRTANEAAAAVGCSVGQIAKSLVFRRVDSNQPVLIIMSGPNRVDEERAATYLDAGIAKADADFVRSSTGFAIGGVPPLGHDRPPETLIDRDLLQFDTIWAAAGTPNTVFPINPHQLVTATGGRVLAIASAPVPEAPQSPMTSHAVLGHPLLTGKCHCGNIAFDLQWPAHPPVIPARACGCSFCVKHGGVWTSHPDARLRIAVRAASLVSKYAFGSRTAMFHVCARCGTVPMVTSEIANHLYAVVNVNVLENIESSWLNRASANFEGEDVESRLARRRRNWIGDVQMFYGDASPAPTI